LTACRACSARLLLLATCAWLGSACASLPRPLYPLRDARQALQRREASIATMNGMRAEARVDQRAKHGGRIRGTVLMFVERAGRVRFDVMTQFGPVAILTSDGARFAYADFRENRYLTGDTCPANIARLLGVPLSAADTARFLLGGTPVVALKTAEMRSSDSGAYLLVLRSPDGQRQELDLAVYPADLKLAPDKQRLYLLRSELLSASGARIWRVTYDEVEPVGSGPTALLMPRKVRIEQAASSSDTLVNFKDVALNPHISDDVFVQSARPGMREEEVSCE
jgi:outer membrane lipoprotein-sorting protein